MYGQPLPLQPMCDCDQAEERQHKFDQSAGGRAARKAVADVAKERQAGRTDNDQMARDWVN